VKNYYKIKKNQEEYRRKIGEKQRESTSDKIINVFLLVFLFVLIVFHSVL